MRTKWGGAFAIIVLACSGTEPIVPSGSVRVTTASAGLDLDRDGYTVRLDAGPQQAVTINGSVILTGVISGAHTLALGGVAANCTPKDGNTSALNVVAGDTADVAFTVTCTSTFVSLSVGYLFACGITIGGGTYCWGINQYGQLGDGDPTGPAQCVVYNGRYDASYPCSTTPVPVSGELRFAAASAGSWHACGITAGGAAYCWGDNRYGELGDGTTTSRASPVVIQGGLRLVAVSAGASHTCGVTTGGAAYCWGENSDGQLGDGTTTNRPIPTPALGGLTFATVRAAAGGGHTCGITTGGATYCWGHNAFGELGDGTTTNRTGPAAVAGGLTFALISAGGGHTCGVTTAGMAYCWGYNSNGQVGDGTTTDRSSPVAVLGGVTFAAVSAGGGHTCGITPVGAALCWGWNHYGQLGDGTGVDTSSPAAVSGGLTFRALSVAGGGGAHTCGLTTTGAAYCWGDGEYGELGEGQSGSAHYSTVPVKVAGQP